MNIFWLDYDLEKSARYLVDRHVVKMILEHAQMLCTACNIYGEVSPYRTTHFNHPCTQWVCGSKDSWEVLYYYTMLMNNEYRFRFHRNHLSWLKIKDLEPPKSMERGIYRPPLCMPDIYKDEDDFVLSYRNYYMGEKRSIAKWTGRGEPDWWK